MGARVVGVVERDGETVEHVGVHYAGNVLVGLAVLLWDAIPVVVALAELLNEHEDAIDFLGFGLNVLVFRAAGELLGGVGEQEDDVVDVDIGIGDCLVQCVHRGVEERRRHRHVDQLSDDALLLPTRNVNDLVPRVAHLVGLERSAPEFLELVGLCGLLRVGLEGRGDGKRGSLLGAGALLSLGEVALHTHEACKRELGSLLRVGLGGLGAGALGGGHF